MTFLIFFLIFLALMLVIMAFARPQSREDATERLRYLKARKSMAEENSRKDALFRKASALGQLAEDSREQLVPFATRLIPANLQETIRQKLDSAGNYDVTIEQHAVTQLLMLVSFPVGFWLLNFVLLDYPLQTMLFATPVLFGVGYYYPIIRLNTRIETRKRAIFRAFPDFLDLLTICLEAGMGMDAALHLLVAKGQPGPFKDELEKTLKEIKVGKPRVQALRDLAKRIDMKEVTSFVVAMSQVEQIGGSLSQTLRVQSDIAREARWQRAQEMAQKAPIKLLFPMMILIFPNIFMVIFGPLILSYILGRL